MSHSIHVATKGQNDYSGYWGAFDHEEEGINALIGELCGGAKGTNFRPDLRPRLSRMVLNK